MHDAVDDSDIAIPAGDFSSWLDQLQGARRGAHDSDVPCGTCTACCTASQFVHIGPEELDALAHIPPALLFPAPRMPTGHVLMGYDQDGHCPMLIDNRCSIYEHRPRTCRTYDCRVLPAAALDIDSDDTDKALIADRAARWVFAHPTDGDRIEHRAVEAAARYLSEHRRELPAGAVPLAATPLAVTAIEVHDLFVGVDNPDEVAVAVVELRLRRNNA